MKLDDSHATAERVRIQAVHSGMAVFMAAFLAGALHAASVKPLWMDEVLSAWAIRLPTAGQVIAAHFHGSESCPPTYNLMLHFLAQLVGDQYWVMRLPAILSTIGTGLCLFALLRRTIGREAAAFGMAFAMLGLLAEYGIQIRPYALVTLCFALACLAWQNLGDRQPSAARVGLFVLPLIAAFSLHFYATLFIPCFACMELLWTIHLRRIRFAVWLGLLAAGLATFLWLPLMRVFMESNKSDVITPYYYAYPTLTRLGEAYLELTLRHPTGQKLLPVTLASLLLVGCIPWLRRRAGRAQPAQDTIRLGIILACSTLVPLIMFVFAMAITGTFNIRYTLAGAIGIAGGCAWGLSRLHGWKLAIFPVLIAAAVIGLLRFKAHLPGFVPPPVQLHDQLPIVIGDGLQYFQIVEAAPDDLKKRLVYVDRPNGVGTRDPTNENLVHRWHDIRRDLNIEDAAGFLAANSTFYILSIAGTQDELTTYLESRGAIEGEVGRTGDARILKAHSPAK